MGDPVPGPIDKYKEFLKTNPTWVELWRFELRMEIGRPPRTPRRRPKDHPKEEVDETAPVS